MNQNRKFIIDNNNPKSFDDIVVGEKYNHINVHLKPNVKEYYGTLNLKYIQPAGWGDQYFFLFFDDDGNERRFLSDPYNFHFLNKVVSYPELEEVISTMKIPIVIICYNNYKYVDNMIKKIIKINPELKNDIIVMDNNSEEISTKKYLDKNILDIVIVFNTKNNGPWVDINRNWYLYDILPDKFVLTDPDLELNDNLPVDFLDILSNLQEKYDCSKIGFALEVKDKENMYDDYEYFDRKSIWEWETLHFWNNDNRIPDPDYEMYKGGIDTTFGLISKDKLNSGNNNINIRVCENFTCRHLPFYVNDPLFTLYDRYAYKNKSSTFSTMGAVYHRYIHQRFEEIRKRDEVILIEKENPFLSWWTHFANTTEYDSDILDAIDQTIHGDKSKTLLIIGTKCELCFYGARKANQVFISSLESSSSANFKINCKNNCDNVVILDPIPVESLLNKIINEYDAGADECLPYTNIDDINNTISLDTLNITKLGLIIVNLDGREEDLMYQLYCIKEKIGIPIYVNFNYNKWKNTSGKLI